MLLLKRLLGALLVLVGIGLAAVGGWFVGLVGSSGTATFTLHPATAAPVVLEPTLLDRLTVPAVVQVTPATGQSVWVGTGGAADTSALLGTAEALHATGVDVRAGEIRTRTTGSGPAPDLTAADVWRREEHGATPLTWTVAQGQNPDTLVVVGDGKTPVAEVSVSWTRTSWFFQSLVLTLGGLLVAGVGGLLLWSTFRTSGGRTPDAAEPGTEVAA